MKTKRAIKVAIVIVVVSLIVAFGVFPAVYNYDVRNDSSITIHETGLPAKITWRVNLSGFRASSLEASYSYNHTIVSSTQDATFTHLKAGAGYAVTLFFTSGYYPNTSSASFPIIAPFNFPSGLYKTYFALETTKALFKTPVHEVFNIGFLPLINLTEEYRLAVNGTAYRLVSGISAIRSNISVSRISFGGGIQVEPLNASLTDYSAYMDVNQNFTIVSLSVTSNVTGFSLLSVTPKLPVYIDSTSGGPLVVDITTPTVPVTASIYITFNITGWSPP